MANKEHVQPLIEAVASMSMASWNYWRIKHLDIRPDLQGAGFADVNLSYADLSYADISHADLSRTNLHHASLRHADLSSTSLQKADLSKADLSYTVLTGADLSGAILCDAKLRGTNLIGANLKDADLKGADLADALLDPNVIERPPNKFIRGVSYLEKLALGLFARAKGKDHLLQNGGTKPPHSGKHI